MASPEELTASDRGTPGSVTQTPSGELVNNSKDGHDSMGKHDALQRVTDLERLQKDLMKARATAEEASRTRSRFLAIMSHEIRTPLNGVLGALQLLAETEPGSTQRELIELATNSAESLRRVSNDVIDLSRLEAGGLELETKTFELCALAGDICEFWRPMAESKGLELQWFVDENLPGHVIGDAVRIRQVANNYLSNAINYTDHGSVRVRLSRDDTIACGNSGDIGVCLEVRDTGPGIPTDKIKYLFQDYYQVKIEDRGQRGGTGLGLAICRELASLMGGNVGVWSAPGQGSTFWARLTLREASIPEDIDSTQHAPEVLAPLVLESGRAPHVLLVEDSVTNQVIAQSFLEQFGCRVDMAADGLEAVDAVKNGDYDVILMDVAMPRMNGLEATRQIRAIPGYGTTLPIVGQTAHALQEDTKTFLASGMDEVITKPLKRDALHAAMRRALTTDAAAPRDDPQRGETHCIDSTLLSQLRKDFPVEQLVELLDRVISDIDTNRGAAIVAAHKGCIDNLARACHTLKGVGASFGDPELESLAALICDACRGDDLVKATAMALSRLETVCANSIAALQAYQESVRAAAGAAERG